MSQAPVGSQRAQGAGVDFDGVLMLTWSDWFSEPRSNRYHYGVRLARQAPVLFVQPTLPSGAAARERPTGIDNLQVLELSATVDREVARAVVRAVQQRGWRRVLLWIYSSTHYGEVLRALPQGFRLYHATEDYLTPWGDWTADDQRVAASVRALLPQIDLLVAVSDRVAATCREAGGYAGPLRVAPNGCDAAFFEALAPAAPRPRERLALFQGGINARLDYELLLQVVQRLPDWEFRFCGRADESLAGWRRLREEPNVRYLGPLEPAQFGLQMHEASVGLIPFQADAWIWNSLPLKAYEYVACGLPVVTVPIEALEREPALFRTAQGAEAFAAAIEQAGATRRDPRLLALRQQAARGQSYDARFDQVMASLVEVGEAALERPKRLNLLVLHGQGPDPRAQAWRQASRHELWFHPWAQEPAFAVAAPGGAFGADLSFFDAVVLWPAGAKALPTGTLRALACFTGPRVLVPPPGWDAAGFECQLGDWNPDLVCPWGETGRVPAGCEAVSPADGLQAAESLDAAIDRAHFHDRRLRIVPGSLLGLPAQGQAELLVPLSSALALPAAEPLDAIDHQRLSAAREAAHLRAALQLAAAASGQPGPAGGALRAAGLAWQLAARALRMAAWANVSPSLRRVARVLPGSVRRALGRALRG